MPNTIEETAPHSSDALLHRLAAQLMPLFQQDAADPLVATQGALAAIAAYQPESRADFVNIARIIAFSMATLSALGLAAAADVLPAQRMRYFGRANALNRSADQSERIMMQRRRDQRANPPGETAAGGLSPAEEVLSDAYIDAAVAEAMAVYTASRANSVRPAQPASPQPAEPASPDTVAAAPADQAAAGPRAMQAPPQPQAAAGTTPRRPAALAAAASAAVSRPVVPPARGQAGPQAVPAEATALEMRHAFASSAAHAKPSYRQSLMQGSAIRTAANPFSMLG